MTLLTSWHFTWVTGAYTYCICTLTLYCILYCTVLGCLIHYCAPNLSVSLRFIKGAKNYTEMVVAIWEGSPENDYRASLQNTRVAATLLVFVFSWNLFTQHFFVFTNKQRKREMVVFREIKTCLNCRAKNICDPTRHITPWLQRNPSLSFCKRFLLKMC